MFFLGGIEQFGAPGKSPKSPNHSRVAIFTPLAPPLTLEAVAIPMVPLAWVHLPPWSFRYPRFDHAQNPVNHGGNGISPLSIGNTLFKLVHFPLLHLSEFTFKGGYYKNHLHTTPVHIFKKYAFFSWGVGSWELRAQMLPTLPVINRL